MLQELLPAPVLAIGLTGHRNLATDDGAAGAVERAIADVLAALQRALPRAVAREANYFSAAAPVTRLVTRGQDGAELLGIRAATDLGLEIAYVVPFAVEAYRRDLSPASAAIAAEAVSRAADVLELPGRSDEGLRAFERANDIVVANIDLLVAVWDGEWAKGRADTADVVQAAVAKTVPVVVIDPHSPGTAAIIAAPLFDAVEPPAASNLPRRPLPADLADFVHSLVAPPPRRLESEALADLIAETARSVTWRFEYPLLLKVAGGQATVRRPTIAAHAAPDHLGGAGAASSSAAYAERRKRIDQARKTIDELATQYGRLFRSSSVSGYLVVILGAWVAGVLGLLFPSLTAGAIAVQLCANMLVLADSALRARHRWQERWLDYRVVAERLRWLSFRASFGLGASRHYAAGMRHNLSWTDWYLQRMARALGPPQGKIDAASIAAAADHLAEVEIPEQIAYHRTTFRRLGRLEQRLFYVANASLAAALAVAVLLAADALRTGSLQAIPWRPLALGLLAVLPATMTGLNGLRVDADLTRLVERSAQTVASLFRIRRAIVAAPREYDHVAANMQRLAAVMAAELADWRFVIESRRARGRRGGIGGRRGVLQALRARRQSG